MTLQATMRAALASIAGLVPELSVTVIADGVSTSGLIDATTNDSSLSEMGVDGPATARVRVSAAAFARPADGSTIKVNGEDAVVTSVISDSVGAMYVISFTKVKPVSD